MNVDELTLSVIMAVYNEKDSVLRVLDNVLTVPIRKQVVIVDNCSTDGTREILEGIVAGAATAGQHNRLNEIQVIFQPQNMGKGNSIRTALERCTGDYTIIQDADLEYDPNEWHLLLKKAVAEDLDAVFGSRTAGGKAVYIYLQNYLGVLFFNVLINVLYGSRYTDTASACKMLRTSVFQALDLRCSGFDLDFEICTQLALGKHSYGEVPVTYKPRSVAEGKKLRAIRDGIATLRVVLRDRFWRKRPKGEKDEA